MERSSIERLVEQFYLKNVEFLDKKKLKFYCEYLEYFVCASCDSNILNGLKEWAQ